MITSIFLDVLAPILLMVGLGALLRWKFDIDLGTLSKLNIYLFVPAFVFDKVSTSTLSWEEMGGVVSVTVVQVVTLGLIVWGVGRLIKIERKTLAAIAMAVMFYNSGNYGLPLAELAYPQKNPQPQITIAPTQHSGMSTHDAPKTGLSAQDLAKNGGAVQAFVLMTQNVLGYTLGLMIAASAQHS